MANGYGQLTTAPAKLLFDAPLYNRVAGQSAEHLAALSHGIFAVAMTLLVLDLHVPADDAGNSGISSRRYPPYCDRAISLRVRRRALFLQHLGHRRYPPGPSKLCHRPKTLLGTLLEERPE
ncbi:MAG TPA: TMEM175 family protein [Candidatus Sulfotelmatobacter sp.]|nr:TMEM175 family protein [Candidatus Sulfotelmatobacter sp.]